MKYRCIAIDDEPLALDIIEDYVSKIDYLELAGRYTSAVKAVSALRESAADILFLDIQMPELSGFELLDSLPQKPRVIFTTAYDSYAVKSYSINAVDYLLKPFPFARFLQAVERAVSQEQPAVVETVPTPPPEPDYIFVASGGKISRMPLSSILFVRGLSDYIEIVTTDKRYVVYETLKHLLEQLDSDDF
ncbi:MAG: DNA-binding response regulator, partial [Ectothiorhodospiraceae bacterium]|nr:DNA-binding response regulator [Ectothiorhodospiraceae bacterium]